MSEKESVTRCEVRPGLVLIKRRTLKEDGRYLIYYDFERPGPPGNPPGGPRTPGAG